MTAALAASNALRVQQVECVGAVVLVDWSTGMPRLLVPPSFQRQVGPPRGEGHAVEGGQLVRMVWLRCGHCVLVLRMPKLRQG